MNGISNFKKVALDSNLFIYFFENNPEFTQFTKPIFNQLSESRLTAITSIISVVETLSYPLPEEIVEAITIGFRTIPNLEIIPLDEKIALEAAQLRRDYGFKLPDSVQLATALVNKAEAFITNDERLKKFPKIPVLLLTSLK